MHTYVLDELKTQPFWILVLCTLGSLSALKLFLVSQNLDKLKDVLDSIQAKYGKTQIKNVVVDFSGDLFEGIKRVSETIEGLDVGVLINNIGVSYSYARFESCYLRLHCGDRPPPPTIWASQKNSTTADLGFTTIQPPIWALQQYNTTNLGFIAT